MPRYIETIDTRLGQADAFAFLSQLENFAKWDPGVRSSVRVVGAGPGLGAIYAVTVNGIGRPMILRYRIVEYNPPQRIVIAAKTRTLRSVDTITVSEHEGGARIRYAATLRFRGSLRLANLLLGPGFRRIAGRAGAGLRKAFINMEQR